MILSYSLSVCKIHENELTKLTGRVPFALDDVVFQHVMDILYIIGTLLQCERIVHVFVFIKLFSQSIASMAQSKRVVSEHGLRYFK